MTMHEIQAMFDRGTTQLDSYLREFENGAPAEHSGFIAVQDGDTARSIPCNVMSVVYERAAYYAAAENSLDWATIAVRAATLWALDEDEWNRKTAMQNSMKLRAGFICTMGARMGHPVLSTEPVLCWVNQGLKVPIDIAREKATRWKKHGATAQGLTAAEIRELRDIKL